MMSEEQPDNTIVVGSDASSSDTSTTFTPAASVLFARSTGVRPVAATLNTMMFVTVAARSTRIPGNLASCSASHRAFA